MKRIKTELGTIYVLETIHNVGEHSFDHYGRECINDRTEDHNDLWSIDVYHNNGDRTARHFVWANTDAKSAAREAMRFVDGDSKVLITHFIPTDDRLREPVAS